MANGILAAILVISFVSLPMIIVGNPIDRNSNCPNENSASVKSILAQGRSIKELIDEETIASIQKLPEPEETPPCTMPEEVEAKNGATPYTRWRSPRIPFKIQPEYTKREKDIVLAAMAHIEQVSCVRFLAYDWGADMGQLDYFKVLKSQGGCFAYVGRQKDTYMNLEAPGCMDLGVAIHELVHVLGFYHQQSAADRDDYITILTENIPPAYLHNFMKQPYTDSFGAPYDYKSTMHYDKKAFSSNGKDTIRTKDPSYQNVIGLKRETSEWDRYKLKKMFKCSVKSFPTPED